MSIGILGKKLGMSQLFDDKGNSVPGTLIEAGQSNWYRITFIIEKLGHAQFLS